MTYWIRIGGRPASVLAPPGPPTWETLADGGCGEGSFDLSVSPTLAASALRPGTAVEFLLGLTQVYAGLVVDYDRSAGRVVTRGLAAAAYDYMSLDGVSDPTRNTETAVSEAQARGWPVFLMTGTFGVAVGEAGPPVPVGDLLTDYAGQTVRRWGVDEYARCYMRSDPTVPKWMVAPGVAAMGTTTEGLVSHYVARYFDGTDNQTAIIAHPKADQLPHVEQIVDLTDRGTLGIMEVSALVGGMFALNPTAWQWTSGVTVTRDQLTTIGGTSAALADVRGGDMVRIRGMASMGLAGGSTIDVVIGKTRYTAGDEVIYLEPVNTAPRTLSDVIAAA